MNKPPNRRWVPTTLIRPKDNIKSSKFHKYVPFSPSYNKDKVNMFLLMAHDYAKLWLAENKAVEVRRFEFAGEENERLCRRYVLRSLPKKKIVEEAKPRFIMKRFRNIPSKVSQYMRPQGTVQRQIAAEKKMAAKTEGKSRERFSKLSRTKDSAEIFRQKFKTGTADEQPMDFDLADVSICSEVVECSSDLEVVSHCSGRQDLTKEVPHKLSNNVPVGHMHILCNGPRIRVKKIPHEGHQHKCKLLAKNC